MEARASEEAGVGVAEVAAWAAGLAVLHARIAGRFARSEPRRRAQGICGGCWGRWVPACG